MAGERQEETAHALRALAAPVTVVCLVVLVLNDHVLKQAWPGPVTGKLSDVVGLVVAPLVLAVPLALLRAPRPALAAVLATGVGFVLVKTTEAGAALATDVWSAVAGPSYLLRDPTDLLALPALLVALRVHWLAGHRPRPLRRRARAAAGAVLLPFAVLATAATSPCDDGEADIAVVEGLWETDGGGWERGSRFVYDYAYALYPTPTGLGIRTMSGREQARVVDGGPWTRAACDPVRPELCWEEGATSDGLEVRTSRDGGVTWAAEEALTAEQVAAVEDAVGERCGQQYQVGVEDVAVMHTDSGSLVVLSLGAGGVVVRDADGRWSHLLWTEVRDRAERAASPGGPRPETESERWRRRHPLTAVDEALPTAPTEPSTVTPTAPPATPRPPCEEPYAVTVTPDPRNGPPTTSLRCDIASSP
jgi:hypothetical protein